MKAIRIEIYVSIPDENYMDVEIISAALREATKDDNLQVNGIIFNYNPST